MVQHTFFHGYIFKLHNLNKIARKSLLLTNNQNFDIILTPQIYHVSVPVTPV